MSITFLNPRVFTIRAILSPDECRQQIEHALASGLIDQDFGRSGYSDVRGRLAQDDVPLASLLWDRIRTHLPPLPQLYAGGLVPLPTPPAPLECYEPHALNPRMRYYRYFAGQRFPPHFDLAYEKSPDERTFLTVILYLNDDSVGGETLFADTRAQPVPGMALLFPHEVLHQGSQLVSGVKWVLRTDVMYRIAGLP